MKEHLAAILSELVSIPSVDGQPKEKARVLAFARNFLEESGADVTLYDDEAHPSLIAKVPGVGEPILLLTHLDVVPATETMFEMRREGDKVFGRGVLDDKGPSVICMLAMAELARSFEPHAPVTLVLSTDEEIGSRDGVEKLVAMGVLNGHKAVIALDGGDEGQIVRQEKGLLHLTLQAHGKTAHNSTPWEGDNAIEKMLRVYSRIKSSLHHETTDADRWKTTVSIGTIEGGQFVNQVPGSCIAKIDIRFTDDTTLYAITKTVEAALEEGVRMLDAQGGHPFETPEDDPLLALYVASMSEALDKPMQLTSEHGATDARFFRSMNVPIWLHYPEGGDIHTDDEWMNLASAEKVLNGLITFVHRASNS